MVRGTATKSATPAQQHEPAKQQVVETPQPQAAAVQQSSSDSALQHQLQDLASSVQQLAIVQQQQFAAAVAAGQGLPNQVPKATWQQPAQQPRQQG